VTKSSVLSRALPVLAVLAIVMLVPPVTYADARVQRFTLVVGANYGGAERPRLQYAVSDAERFARVLVELGGVSRANEIVLRQPKLADLIDALDRLALRVADARRTAGSNGGRTEVLVYYSGHADERGLLLGDDRYSYRTLRDRLDQIPADVRIAVLDACASGAFTRIKSGRARPAFLVDDASNMRGHAFLTSSAATEAAQESDRIRASYFTHYLVSGFRGAADLSGDGRITLNEAYQFAFNETLGRTVDSKAGPQHPSYDISLSGTGDVVMTDIRQTTATLVLGEDLEGRFFVRNAQKELIVELFKPRGRRVELGVEAGTYEVRLEIQKTSLLAKTEIADGARVVLEPRQFGPAALEATRRRGDAERPDLSVDGRNRFSFRWGTWRTRELNTGDGVLNDFGGIEFTRYLREDFAITLGVHGPLWVQGATFPQFIFLPGTGPVLSGESTIWDSGTILSVPVVLRWNPLTTGREHRAVKPFLAIGAGPVFGWGRETRFNGTTFGADEYRLTAASVHLGTGVDLHLTRRFAVGLNVGYNTMIRSFSRPVGARSHYSAPEFGVSVGWTFGRGRGRRNP
jgi:hypothetical protein